MDFTFLEVNNNELLEKVFEFRYKVFLETYPEYIKSLNLKEKKEKDEYDPYSIHFVAIDQSGNICATVRLIHNSPFGYPTENNMQLKNEIFNRDKLGEMSRIFVDSKYRNIQTTKIIIQEVKKFMYMKMTNFGIEYTYGSLESGFLRLLKIYKMNYVTIGEEQMHENIGLRYPCVLYTKQLGIDNPEFSNVQENNY